MAGRGEEGEEAGIPPHINLVGSQESISQERGWGADREGDRACLCDGAAAGSFQLRLPPGQSL